MVYEEAIAEASTNSDPESTFIYSELIVGTQRVEGGCRDWAVFTSALTQSLAGPKKVSNVTMFALNEFGTSILNRHISCEGYSQSVADITSGLITTSVGSRTVICSGFEWRTEKCGAGSSGVNTCVDCTDVCSSTVGGSNQCSVIPFFLSPCGVVCPVTSYDGGKVAILRIDMVNKSPPPLNTSTLLDPSKISFSLVVNDFSPCSIYWSLMRT